MIAECQNCYFLDSDLDGLYLCLCCKKYYCKIHSFEHSELENHFYFRNQQNNILSDIYYITKNQTLKFINENNESNTIFLNNLKLKKKTKPLVCGFINLGNTCYMNSTIHMLFSINELIDYFINTNENNFLIFEFKRILIELLKGERNIIQLQKLRKAINIDSIKFNEPLPQDSQEYVNYVINTINKYCSNSPINLLKFSNQFILKIPLPLNEIEINFESLINLNFNFNNLSNYLLINPILDINGFKKKVKFIFNYKKIIIKNNYYELISFMEHFGKFSIDGHDICYSKINDIWYKFDDTFVEEISTLDKYPFGTQYHFLLKKMM